MFGAVLFSFSPVAATSYSFVPEADAYVWQGAPAANYGSQTVLHA
jgi:hypothetical protein